jgi:hypothetical protein
MPSQQFRVIITSIGTAAPTASAAIASGLGLPISTVVSRLYSAPAILIDGIDKSIAKGMVTLLSSIGYEAEAQDSSFPAPVPSPLLDVAIYLNDARQFQHAIQVVSNFTGMNEDDASRMIMSPPGVILGSVSEAIVEALEERLGEGISVLASLPDSAHYHLFLTQDSGANIHKRILKDIEKAGVTLLGPTGLVATHVNHKEAQNLWRRYQASGLIRIVNEAFLRFDLVLEKSMASKLITSKQIELLEELAEIPPHMACKVLQAAPITLLESVPSNEIQQQMASFIEAGLAVRADMITFQMLGLEVTSVSNPSATKHTLERFQLHEAGHPLPQVPFIIQGFMPELRARVIRCAIENTGANIAFVEEAV